jgi:hypothetical protein
MATTIQDAFKLIEGNLLLMERNTEKGWFEFEIGIPANWVFDENRQISCEVINETDAGKLIRVAPKNKKISLDDLIRFVEIILETNQKIAEKEREFTDSMEAMKAELEKKAKQYYEELDKLKEESFKKAGDKFVEDVTEKRKTTTRTRKPATKTQPKEPEVETTEEQN